MDYDASLSSAFSRGEKVTFDLTLCTIFFAYAISDDVNKMKSKTFRVKCIKTSEKPNKADKR